MLLSCGLFVVNLNVYNCISQSTLCNIIIFIAIAIDESVSLDVLHFPVKSIKSYDLYIETTPMGGASKPAKGVVCLPVFA